MGDIQILVNKNNGKVISIKELSDTHPPDFPQKHPDPVPPPSDCDVVYITKNNPTCIWHGGSVY
jgi:hypothetical protein